MTKFQDGLRKAIKYYGTDCCIEYWHGSDIPIELESLISRAVDRTDVLCQLCLDNVTNFPPGPNEPNINTYKKALEMACNYKMEPPKIYWSRRTTYPYNYIENQVTEYKAPEYWISKAEAERSEVKEGAE